MFFSLMVGMTFYACQKKAEMPIPVHPKKATLDVQVLHHYWTIPNIAVYLKKNVIDFPGKDSTLYDTYQVTNQAGNVEFRDLEYGNYYLYVKGWDPVFYATVIGYKPVVISDSSAAGGIIDDRVFVSE